VITPDPITAYLGVNGSGKSLSAVAFCLRDQKRTGRALVTNMYGLSAPHYRIDSVEELPDLMAQIGSCNILLDEAGAMFSSRDSGRNKAFQVTCQQLRKYRSRLLWTAPTFARAEKILREVTFKAILCVPVVKKSVPGDPWPSTRLVFQKGFDVSRLDTSGQTMNKNAKARGFGLVVTSRWQDAFDSWGVAGDDGAIQPLQLQPVDDDQDDDIPA